MARERMSSVDTAWLRMDSAGNLMMIVGVDVFEKPVAIGRIREVLTERLLGFKRFRQKVELDSTGAAFWVTDRKFDLDHHLKAARLPGKGGDHELQKFVGDLASEKLDPGRPLWQFHLVSNYKGTSALVARIHHCIADGIALVGVMLSLTDSGAAPAQAVRSEPGDLESNPWSPYLKPITEGTIKAINVTGTAWSKSLEMLADPEKLTDYGKIGTQVLKDALKIALMANDSATSLKGKPGASKVVAWNEPLDLEEVKIVCKALGASINDVLLSCVAGALRNYLLSRGEDVEGCEIRAMVPVNLRPLDSALDLGNRFGLVPLILPVGIANPVARVREIHRRMDELKDGYQAVLAFTLLSVIGYAPKPVQTMVLDFLAKKSTAVMTNVPGPREPLYLAGQKLTRMMVWVPQSGDVGMGVSILSYAGGVQFGLITDRGLCPEPQRIIDGFAPEFEKLVLLLGMLPAEMFMDSSLDPDAFEHALFDYR